MEVITYEIQQQVKVRKYNVDCKKLCNLLRTHKKLTGLNNKRIAELLNVSITKVEHWFRKDKCFSIPDEDVWLSLKQILNIATNDFDLAITTFEEKDNVFEKGNRIYDSKGIAPTITCGDAGLTILERIDTMEVKIIGQMDNTIDHTFESANRVYDKNGLSPTINCCGGGGLQPKIIDDTYANREPRVYEDFSPALRSEREGLKTIETISTKGKQIEVASTILAGYERTNMTGFNADNAVCENVYDFYNNNLKSDGVCGTLTSACSHNGSGTFGVIEPQLIGGIGEKWGDKQYRQGNRVYDSESVAMAVTSQPLGNMGGNSYMYLTREPQYRIRKLTSRECWRLMDFTDEDFEKAAQVNSNTQLYRQAGNSICKNVLVAILGMMIPGKEDVYKKLETR